MQSLEKQNANLVDQNASLEEEYRKVAAFKPLMESYKTQIADLEGKVVSRTRELDMVRFELEQTKSRLRTVESERAKDSETLELYQERVRELESNSHRQLASGKPGRASVDEEADAVEGSPSERTHRTGDGGEYVDDDEADQGLSGELDDALTGTTMTDLKLQVRN